MKKHYIVPTSVTTALSAKENVLNATSNFEISIDEVDDALTTEQDMDPANWSYWDD